MDAALSPKNFANSSQYAAGISMRAAKTTNRAILAHNVRTLMKRRGWTQDTLANKAGISQTHVGNIVRQANDVSTAILEAIGGAFGVPGWLLLIPDLPPELLDSPELPAMVDRYVSFAGRRT